MSRTDNAGEEREVETNEHNADSEMERRNFLKGVSVAGVTAGSALLSGCSGGNGNGDGGDGSDGSDGSDGGDGGDGDDGGDGGASTNEEVYYITMEQDEFFRDYWDRTAEAFEERHGMSINIEYGWDTGYNQRIAEQIQADNAPDVINLEGFNVGQYITEGIMADVTDIVDPFADEYGLPEQFRMEFEGGDRWFPFFAAATVHWCRGDQMEEAGYEGSGPANTFATYDEYLDFMNTMDGVNDMRAGLVGGGETHWGTYYTWSHLWANNIQVADMEGADQPVVNLDNQRSDLVDFIERYKELYDAGSPNTGSYSWTESIDSLADGQVHESLYGGARHKRQAFQRDQDWAIDVEPTATPKYDGSEKDYTFPSGWGVTNLGDNTEGGKQYVSMIMNDEDFLTEFFQVAPTHDIPVADAWRDIDHPVWDVPLVNEGYTDEQFNRLMDIWEAGDPLFHEPTRVFGTSDHINKWSSNMYMTFALGRMMFEHFQNGQSPDEAIDIAIGQLEESLP